MPKYWGKQIFANGRFPRSGSKAKDGDKKKRNTPGTAGGPDGRDRTLALKSKKDGRKSFFSRKKNQNYQFFLHSSSSYDKILGEKLFRTREIPRSGSKAEDGEKREKERKKEERKLVKTMAKLRMAHASRLGQQIR